MNVPNISSLASLDTPDSLSSLSPSEIHRRVKEAGNKTWTGRITIHTLPCDCLECAQQYRSVKEQRDEIHCLYAGHMTGPETASLSHQFCTRLFKDLLLARSILQSYGELVHKRWLKKSYWQRKAFLKRIRPEMHERQNAFLDIQCTNSIDAMTTRKHRDTFLLPYLTTDTLSSDGSRLLRLLHHRVSHAPEEFVPFDNRQLLAGWLAGTFEEKFNGGCIIMCGKWYGTWKPFNEKDVHNGDCYCAPRALLILEAQSIQARFLHDFVTAMVADVDKMTVEERSKTLALTAIHEMKPPQLGEFSWMEFGMTYYNEPFSPPPVFNDSTIDQLIELVSGKQAETQDNLWLLQTDPAYFHQTLSYWSTYTTDTMPGSSTKDDERAHALGDRVMHSSFFQAQSWKHLAEELHHVRREYKAGYADIKTDRQLPEAYDRAVGSLSLLVMNLMVAKAAELKELSYTSPSEHSKWKIVPQLTYNTGIAVVERRDGSALSHMKMYKADHILFCLSALGERPESKGSIDIALLLKSLDLYLAQCKKGEAMKIHPVTYNTVTDLAAMYRILAALRMHRPTPTLRYSSFAEVIETRDSQAWRLCRKGKGICKIMENPANFRYGNKLNDGNKYQMPKGRRNERWLERAESARNALSEVWSLARENFRNMYQTLNINEADTEDMIRMLSHHDSPEFLATVAQEKDEIMKAMAQSDLCKERPASTTVPYQSSIPHISAPNDRPEKAASFITPVKSKVKSRQENSPAVTSTHEEGNLEPASPPTMSTRRSLPLPKKSKSLDTLRLLFPTAVSETKGIAHWTDFVATMQELGFHGEHRGGSEWTFWSIGNDEDGTAEPEKEGQVREKRSIVIHQPHPETKMGSLSLQWIGKRLQRRFGWARECFEGL